MNEKKYYLGLDIGTNSVGWAVTDYNYKLIKKHKRIKDLQTGKVIKSGQYLWGVRLFEDAKPSSERRQYRANRRRLARRKWRINILREIFKPHIDKIDPTFFDRLDNSSYHFEDKNKNARATYLLFNDHKYTDKEFYKKYPTIYHLRKALLENKEQFDLREVYLAIAHIIKYRGNFLTQQNISEASDYKIDSTYIYNSFNKLKDIIDSINEENNSDVILENINCSNEQADKLFDLFQKESGKLRLLDGEKEIFNLNNGKDKFIISLFRLINGAEEKVSSFDFNETIDSEIDSEEELNIKINFSKDDFETVTLRQLEDILSNDLLAIIKEAKNIYDLRLNINILGGEPNISNSMVNIYETHKNQLKELKRLFKKYAPDEKKNFFNLLDGSTGTYANYINKEKLEKADKKLSKDEMYSKIKKIFDLNNIEKDTWKLKEICTPEDKQILRQITLEINNQKYLNKQNSKDNGTLPYQLNENELRKIIENQKEYYPFLADKDKKYLDPTKEDYKLISLLKFKIPYYVGPLSTKHNSPNKWAIRQENSDSQKIYPWNFNDVVNVKKSAEEFINRMTNSCTYIYTEKALPKCSLIYQRYELLNEINTWLINGEPIKKEDKEYIIENVYLKTKKPTKKIILEELKKKYKDGEITISTSNAKELSSEDLHATLSSWIDMADDRAFGKQLFNDNNLQEKAEKIIKTITLFEDKALVKETMEEMKLSSKQIKYFLSLNYKNWGKLSEKLLTGLKTETENTSTGELINNSIMDLLEETNQNFGEIYESKNKYDFKEQVKTINNANKEEIDNIIDAQYLNNPMKKAVRQTLKLISELKKVLHIDCFAGYFIESTRHKEKSKRTVSRKQQVLEKYKSAIEQLKKENNDNELNNLNTLYNELTTKDSLDQKKLYLYYLQQGKSVYSGKPINLDKLETDYDVDHIIPRAKLVDNSFENLVLVERDLNNKKGDKYPISSSIITEEGRKWIRTLNKLNLMSTEKMNKILRPESRPLTDDELTGFVNRQLTTTNQSVKAVREILEQTEKNSNGKEPNIVYSKANLVSEFRKTFDLYKNRDLNNYHHAHDAYLNIVVGNTYNKIFTNLYNIQLLRNSYDAYEGMRLDVEHFFRRDLYSDPYNTTRIWHKSGYYDKDNNKWIEDETDDGDINTVKKYIYTARPLITYATYTQPGIFKKASIHPVKDKEAMFPLKQHFPFNSENWQQKYGGYNNLTAAYFLLICSDKISKKKVEKQYSLETIPKYLDIKVQGNINSPEIIKYLTEQIKINNPVVITKCLIRTIIDLKNKEDFTRVLISGKTNDSINYISGEELVVDKQYNEILHQISKLFENTTLEKLKEATNLQYKLLNIDDNTLDKLFDYFCTTIFTKSKLYNIPSFNTAIKVFKDNQTTFKELDKLNKCYIILQILKMFMSLSADLSIFNKTKTGAKIFKNKKLQSGTRIIQTSYTGLYETIICTIP